MKVNNNSGAELMRVTNDGKVGIGTTTPAYKLDVAGGISGAYTPKYVEWDTYSTGDGGAAIYNDNGTRNELVITGNDAANDGKRNISLWDDVYIPHNLSIGGRQFRAKLWVKGLGEAQYYNTIPHKSAINTHYTAESQVVNNGVHATFGISPSISMDTRVRAVDGGGLNSNGKTIASGHLVNFDKLTSDVTGSGIAISGSGIAISGAGGYVDASLIDPYFAADPNNSWAAAVTAAIGNNTSNAAKVYAIFANGAKSYFSNSVGIGTTTPGGDMLDVRGRAYASGGWQTSNGDYAEWFEKQGDSKPGDVIGIDLETGKARRYQPGDKFLGIHSSKPAIVGNRIKENDDEMSQTHILVGLLGQLDVQSDQISIKGRLVYTKDNTYIGVLLSNNKIFVGR